MKLVSKTLSLFLAICMLATMITVPLTVGAAVTTKYTIYGDANSAFFAGYNREGYGATGTAVTVTDEEGRGTKYGQIDFTGDYGFTTNGVRHYQSQFWTGAAFDETADNKKFLSFDINAPYNDELYVAIAIEGKGIVYYTRLDGQYSVLKLFADGYLTSADADKWVHVDIPVSDFEAKVNGEVGNTDASSSVIAFGTMNSTEVVGAADYTIFLDEVLITEAPNVKNAKSTAATGTSVTLTWDTVADAIKYEIYRDGVYVGTSTTNSFTETTVPEGTYDYQIRAYQTATLYGESALVRVNNFKPEKVIPAFEAPYITSIKTVNGGNKISWAINNTGYAVDKYILYKDGAELIRLAGDVTSYLDLAVATDESHNYALRAITPDPDYTALSPMGEITGAVIALDSRYTEVSLFTENLVGATATGAVVTTDDVGLGKKALMSIDSLVEFSLDTPADLTALDNGYLKFLAKADAADALDVQLSSGDEIAATLVPGKWTMVKMPLADFVGFDGTLSSIYFTVNSANPVYLDDIQICYDYVYVNPDYIRVHTFDSDDMFNAELNADPSKFLGTTVTKNIYVDGKYSYSADGVNGSHAAKVTGAKPKLVITALPMDSLSVDNDNTLVKAQEGSALTYEFTFKADSAGDFSFGFVSGMSTSDTYRYSGTKRPLQFNADGTITYSNCNGSGAGDVVYSGLTWEPGKWYTVAVKVDVTNGIPAHSITIIDPEGNAHSLSTKLSYNIGNAWCFQGDYILLGYELLFIPKTGEGSFVVDNIYTYDKMVEGPTNLVDGKVTDRNAGLNVSFTGIPDLTKSTGIKVVDMDNNPVDAKVKYAANGHDLAVSLPTATYGSKYKLVWDSISGYYTNGTVGAKEIEFEVAQPVDVKFDLAGAATDSLLQSATTNENATGVVSTTTTLKNNSTNEIAAAVVEMAMTGNKIDKLIIDSVDLAPKMKDEAEVSLSLDATGSKASVILVNGLLSTEEEPNQTFTFEEIDPIAQTVKVKGNMPHGLENQIVTFEVINPGKTVSDLTLKDAASAADVYNYIAKAVTGKDGSFEFIFDLRDLGITSVNVLDNTYTIRLGGDNTPIKQTFEALYFGKGSKNQLMDDFYAAADIDELKLTYPDLDQYMLILLGDTIDILADFADKTPILETAHANKGTKTDLSAFTTLLKDSIALTALNTNKAEAFDADGKLIESVAKMIGIAEDPIYNTYLTGLSDTGISAVNATITGKAFTKVADVKETFLAQTIIKAIRYPEKLGTSHVSKIILANKAYLESKGFDVERYEDMESTEFVDDALIEEANKDSATLGSIKELFNETEDGSSSDSYEDPKDQYRPDSVLSNGGGSKPNNTYIGNFIPPVVDDEEEPAKNNFTDLDTVPWAVDSINTLVDKGIINGMSDTIFAPNANVTREQFVKMLTLALGIYDPNAKADFVDVPAYAWSYSYVASAYNAGIVKGISDTEFGATANITRQDAAVMIDRAIKAINKSLVRVEKAPFADASDIADYALEAVTALYESDVVNGRGDNQFAPKDYMTRAEAAKLLCELLIKVA